MFSSPEGKKYFFKRFFFSPGKKWSEMKESFPDFSGKKPFFSLCFLNKNTWPRKCDYLRNQQIFPPDRKFLFLFAREKKVTWFYTEMSFFSVEKTKVVCFLGKKWNSSLKKDFFSVLEEKRNLGIFFFPRKWLFLRRLIWKKIFLIHRRISFFMCESHCFFCLWIKVLFIFLQ